MLLWMHGITFPMLSSLVILLSDCAALVTYFSIIFLASITYEYFSSLVIL